MASVLKVDKLDPQSGTALEIGTSGDTISIPSGATLDISASTLTPPATMPASSGINFTALNASNLGSGTVPAARLSGTGKIGQVVSVQSTTNQDMAVSSYTEIDSNLRLAITPSATTSKILYMFSTTIRNVDTSNGAFFDLYVDVAAAGYNSASGGDILKYTSYQMGANTYNNVAWSFYDEPATTSALIYSPYYKGANTSVIGIGDAAYIQTWAMEILA